MRDEWSLARVRCAIRSNYHAARVLTEETTEGDQQQRMGAHSGKSGGWNSAFGRVIQSSTVTGRTRLFLHMSSAFCAIMFAREGLLVRLAGR
jgi:hypothetical protein